MLNSHIEAEKIQQMRQKTLHGEKYILIYILQGNITDFSPNLTP